MSKDKEISATEKLLEMIRGEDEKSPPPLPKPTNEPDPDIVIDGEPDDLVAPLSLESESREKNVPIKENDNHVDSTPVNDISSEKSLSEGFIASPNPTPEGSVGTGQNNPKEQPISSEPTLTAKVGRKLLKSPLPILKTSSKEQIGVDIQNDCINFAKLRVSSTPEPKLKNYLAIPIPSTESAEESPDQSFQGPEFAKILSHNLTAFCRNTKAPEIWCSFQSENIQVHNITIPKVPQKEIANAVFWSTKKEVEFDPAEYIYDFSIIKETKEGNLKKIITLVYLFPRKEVDLIKNIFKKTGFPLTGITHSSSAINNCFKHKILATDENPCVHLHFEKFKSYIDVYSQGAMLFTREIKTGINSYAESVFDLASAEDLILDDESAIELAFDKTKDILSRSGNLEDKQTSELGSLLDLKDLAATGRLVRQLNRTFDFCSAHFKVPRASNLFNSGFFTLKNEILNEIQSETDVTCSVVDIFKNDPEKSSQKDRVQNYPESSSPMGAIGLALANNTITPNILFTFADKKKRLQENRVNHFISVMTIFLAIAIGIGFFFQLQSVKGKEEALKMSSEELERSYKAEPRSRDTSFALMATKKISKTIKETSEKARRFTIIAVVKEVTSQVQKDIKLTYLRIERTEINDPNNPESKSVSKMILRGFVSGKETTQNFTLLNFQKDLNQIPLIAGANISSRRNTVYNGDEILYFTMEVNLKLDLF